MKTNNWTSYVFHVTQKHYDFLDKYLGYTPQITDDIRLFLEMSFSYIDYEIGKYKHHIKCDKERLKENKYGFNTPETIKYSIEINTEIANEKIIFRNELIDYVIKNKFSSDKPLVYPFMSNAGYSFMRDGIDKEKCINIFNAKIELLREEIKENKIEKMKILKTKKLAPTKHI